MTTQRLDGRVDQAFGHMLLVGLCAIAEQQGIRGCRVQWTSEMVPQALIHFNSEWEEVCVAVRSHAERLSQEGSWINAASKAGGMTRTLFSPRVKAIPDDGWTGYEADRKSVIEGLVRDDDLLSLRMIGSLGRPAYWGQIRAAKRQQDDGASRWEMAARNHGSEFIAPRFRQLGLAVTRRSPDSIGEGLLGNLTLDEHGRLCPGDSRIATGLRAPGRTDAAAAWCALWGISQFPLAPHVRATSGTAGYVGRFSRGDFLLPVPTMPMRLSRYRSIVSSNRVMAFAQAARANGQDDTPAEGERARVWLAERSVAAVVSFPMFVSSNVNAPERWAKVGTIHSTAAPLAAARRAAGP